MDRLKSPGQCCSPYSCWNFIGSPRSPCHALSHDWAVEIPIAASTRVRDEVHSDTTVFRHNKTWAITDNAAWLTAKWCATLLSGLALVVDGTKVAFSTRVGIAGIFNDKSGFVWDWTRLYKRERERESQQSHKSCFYHTQTHSDNHWLRYNISQYLQEQLYHTLLEVPRQSYYS